MYSEYSKEDVHKLLTLNKIEEISKIIAAIEVDTPTG
jgi:hypothetical protein